MKEGLRYYIATDTEHNIGVESILYISENREKVLQAIGEHVLENKSNSMELEIGCYEFKNGKI